MYADYVIQVSDAVRVVASYSTMRRLTMGLAGGKLAGGLRELDP
jgi:hypothetical protein